MDGRWKIEQYSGRLETTIIPGRKNSNNIFEQFVFPSLDAQSRGFLLCQRCQRLSAQPSKWSWSWGSRCWWSGLSLQMLLMISDTKGKDVEVDSTRWWQDDRKIVRLIMTWQHDDDDNAMVAMVSKERYVVVLLMVMLMVMKPLCARLPASLPLSARASV